MLIHPRTSSSPVREPRTDLSADHPAALLLTRYAGCVGRVLGEVLIAAAADECAGYLPAHRGRDGRGERS
jgi:hypothetical protein